MTKVYLVEEGGGSWEDKWKIIHSAYFDETKATAIKAKLEEKWNKKQTRYQSLDFHVENCDKSSCKRCDEFYDLQNDIQDGRWYSITEIKVE